MVIAQGFLIPLNPPGSPVRATKTPMSLSIYSIPAGTWQRVRPPLGPAGCMNKSELHRGFGSVPGVGEGKKKGKTKQSSLTRLW